ncbi:hypothetical protein TURU_004420 [Turdus rufiventris]|nr:hypothetical protein TURU_004420 [Turdus rufiventris]
MGKPGNGGLAELGQPSRGGLAWQRQGNLAEPGLAVPGQVLQSISNLSLKLLSLERVKSTYQFGIIIKFANGALNSCILTIGGRVEWQHLIDLVIQAPDILNKFFDIQINLEADLHTFIEKHVPSLTIYKSDKLVGKFSGLNYAQAVEDQKAKLEAIGFALLDMVLSEMEVKLFKDRDMPRELEDASILMMLHLNS